MADPAEAVVTQAQLWDRLSGSWDQATDALEAFIGPLGDLAIRRLDPRPGEQVLDIGCGTGATTVALAGRVGTDGRASGIDISAEMIGRARRRALPDNVRFVVGDVANAALEPASYDAAFSRFGVMFFDDPVVGFRAIATSLRPGGRLSFVCWQAVAANELMRAPNEALLGALGRTAEVPAPGDPGPFSLADPDRIREVLDAGGFAAVELESHTDPASIPAASLPSLAAHSLHAATARGLLRDLDDSTRRRAEEAALTALTDRVKEGQATFARAAWVVTAKAAAGADAAGDAASPLTRQWR